MEEQSLLSSPQKSKSKYWKFAVGFLGIIILVAGGYFVWNKYLSPEAKSNRETERNYQKYLDWQKNYEDAMKNDTYGGKTPEETLKMFIDALKKGDAELASKYFMLEDDTNDPNYLTRKKWEDGISAKKESGAILDIINVLSRARVAGSVMDGYYGFEARDSNGEIIADINMRLNTYSQVWKIESM